MSGRPRPTLNLLDPFGALERRRRYQADEPIAEDLAGQSPTFEVIIDRDEDIEWAERAYAGPAQYR